MWVVLSIALLVMLMVSGVKLNQYFQAKADEALEDEPVDQV